VPRDRYPHVWKEFDRLMEGGLPQRFENPILTKDGEERFIVWQNSRLMQGGKAVGTLSYRLDITDRIRVEEELRIKDRAIETSRTAIAIADLSGQMTYVNPVAVKLWGYEDASEIVGRPGAEFWADRAEADSLVERVRTRGHDIREMRALCKDGSTRRVRFYANVVTDDKGQPLCLLGSFMDLTESDLAEEALRRVQKLESLSVLAGGIAHDFNNILGGIFGYIDLAIEKSRDERVTRYLDNAMGAIDRARALTEQLLTFAKGGAPLCRVAALSPFIEETARFALSGSRVSCSFDMADDLSPCSFDRNQIGQVLENVVINAEQAMPLGGGIEITAENVTFKEGAHPVLRPGPYIRISVKDQGMGIPRDHLPRVFDPFFSTKTRGHGLGLATSYSVVKQHNGDIDVESVTGEGSTFHIYLPATDDAPADFVSRSTDPYNGHGKILIMDDEPLIRDTLSEMLVSLGFTVATAIDGEEALERFQTEADGDEPFRALIFDLTIPGAMGGRDAVGQIRRLDTEVPVFVASGYGSDPVMANPEAYGFSASIKKPFRKSDLVEMLKAHL